MKKPIAVTAAVIALGVAGTAVAAPNGGVFGGSHEERQAELAGDLAERLDGVDQSEVEQGLEEVHAERQAEMLSHRAEELAGQLDGVSVGQATAALESVQDQLKSGAESGQRPDRTAVDELLAEELGVSADELEKARQSEALNRVSQAVNDGHLTKNQANKIREQIKSGKAPAPGRRHHGPGMAGPGGPGGPGGPVGPGGPETGFGPETGTEAVPVT